MAPRETENYVFKQNFGMTNKEYYGMLWYFLEWSIGQLHDDVILLQLPESLSVLFSCAN